MEEEEEQVLRDKAQPMDEVHQLTASGFTMIWVITWAVNLFEVHALSPSVNPPLWTLWHCRLWLELPYARKKGGMLTTLSVIIGKVIRSTRCFPIRPKILPALGVIQPWLKNLTWLMGFEPTSFWPAFWGINHYTTGVSWKSQSYLCVMGQIQHLNAAR